MASCYICGQYIGRNEGYRRRIKTGDSLGFSFGRRIVPSTRTYYGVRTLCQNCATESDKREKYKTLFWIVVIGGVILLGLLGKH